MQVAWHEVPKALDNLFYALEPLISGVLLTNILQYAHRRAVATRKGTHWQVYGPVYLIAAANVLCMLQPLAVLFIYVGEVGEKMWKNGSWFPNTPHGILFYLAKWIGTACLMVGVVQITQLHLKIAKKWREIRNNGSSVASYKDQGDGVTIVKPSSENCEAGG